MGFIVKTINGKKPDIKKASYIADGVFIAGDVRLDENVSIWSNCSLRADLASIVIGRNSNIQENCVIHVSFSKSDDYRENPKGHVIIGENTSIGHSCIIHTSRIGNNCLIGMGSTIDDNCIIEDGSFIATASNLTPRTIVRSGELWFGNPARFMRKLRDTDIQYIKKRCNLYIELAKRFSESDE